MSEPAIDTKEYAIAQAISHAKQAGKLEEFTKELLHGKSRLEAALARIAEAHGITTPLVLISMAENDDENYAEILARHVEKKMAERHAEARAQELKP